MKCKIRTKHRKYIKIIIYSYDVVKSHNFSKLFSVEIPNSRVQFMDFSKKNDYLLYLDEANEITIIDMTNQNKIKAIQINTDYNWASDGIQISEKVKVGFNRVFRIYYIDV